MFRFRRAMVSEAIGLRYQGEAWGAMPVVRCVGSTREGVSAKVRRASPLGGSSAGLAFAECPRRTDSNSKPSSRVRTSPDSEHQFDEMKGTGEIRSRAEPQPNKFSPAPMLFFGPNSAPNSGRIPPRYTLVAPGVRIPPSPPHSLACFPTLWRSDEIGAWGAIHARPWTRRMATAAAERENRLKFSVRAVGMSICEPADILRRSVLGKNAA